MAWHGSLDLDFRLQRLDGASRTVGRATHEGPLRVLRSHYPEDPTMPPGGCTSTWWQIVGSAG